MNTDKDTVWVMGEQPPVLDVPSLPSKNVVRQNKAIDKKAKRKAAAKQSKASRKRNRK